MFVSPNILDIMNTQKENKPFERDETQQELPTHVKAVFDAILEKYEPATITDRTVTKTTKEIYDQLQEHCPSSNYDQERVFNFLSENGFTYNITASEFHFEWMMKLKAKQ
jgi:Cdc6-like AAA superfamily ATPase